MTFASLQLNKMMLSALPSQLTTPTDIQRLAIPAVIQGKDVLALAQTGSGKTFAFGLPMLQKIDAGKNEIQSLILVPTRELASQVTTSLQEVASKLGIKVVMLSGGVSPDTQQTELERGTHVLVATPGRLLDFINKEFVSLQLLKLLVLDEADRLLEMGFWPDVQKIISFAPAARQTLLFSATLPESLEAAAVGLMYMPERIVANSKNSVVEDIKEQLYLVNKGSKPQALIALLKQNDWQQVLVFVSEKKAADTLAKRLTKAGISVAALHGDKEQSDREQTLADFKSLNTRVLITTDLLSRGIHVDALPVVINADLPENAPVYVHRVGRTARAGQNGLAISLVCHGEAEALKSIRQLTGRSMKTVDLEGFPVTDKPAEQTTNTERKRPPRDKKANRRSQAKKSIKQFKPKRKASE
ncbi:DEAD/DEAH box helicase [Photobacterium sp. DNB23_23_1]|uniref:DEAD/DEAH box helicase n=1 Tax=Photobacterium pectinilyticum TaxID=2906793 RepID=A0ABT1MWV1_9GAMM|nr:DEAD/DEAH box helicase [Photobacterium sp. ZSDE20]MCQ1056839.1 DEAD/DEAH box helicase [Photobacterium sp. ZSDE20]MDD1820974.1 DEAD/DEAH box helicase [Photobacterium sp. ZSDE20]